MTHNYEKFNQALRLLNGRLELTAAGWSRSHDPSEGYRQGVQWFLKEFGYGHLVDRV